MNVIHFIILSQFVLVSHTSRQNSKADLRELEEPSTSYYKCRGAPSDSFKLNIIENDNVISKVNLKRTNRVLANKHLPIWTLHGVVDIDNLDNENADDLQFQPNVMKRLGQFETYQERETSSSAIYFHKRHKFDGMIGYQYLIHELPIDHIQSSEETTIVLDQGRVFRRPEILCEHDEDMENDPEAGINYQGYMKTYEKRVYNGYPEVLVIISWDVAEYLCQNVAVGDHYATIVSHVLVLFNGVDMLYRKLQETNIQINIAGIIIGKEKESFYFLDDCYFPVSTGRKSQRGRLGGRCTNSHFQRFLNARRGKIPIQSYDIAVFLTREKMVLERDKNNFEDRTGTFIPVEGISGRIKHLYDCWKEDSMCILIGCITTRGYLANYPVIAHEMAHLMTVNHDEQLPSKPEGKFRNLMKITGGWCDQCLTWSDTSEKTFNLFFSSPNCCTFINEPRSLYPRGRKQMLTADVQCQCYGHKSTRKYLNIPETFCEVELKCKSEDNEPIDTIIPMDGTPCGTNKVCWQGSCDDVQSSD